MQPNPTRAHLCRPNCVYRTIQGNQKSISGTMDDARSVPMPKNNTDPVTPWPIIYASLSALMTKCPDIMNDAPI